MRHFLVCLFLFGRITFAATTEKLTVLLQFEEAPPSTTIHALDRELKSIVTASRLPVRLTLQTEPLQKAVDGDLVIFKMKGTCSMGVIPIGAVSDERGPLAMTHIVNGSILPFADVECDRVRQSVQRTLGYGNPHFYETAYGCALARVMAHELYHMLARSTTHHDSGLTKRGLSSRELITGTMTMSEPAREAITPHP